MKPFPISRNSLAWLAAFGTLAASADIVSLEFGGQITSIYDPTGAVSSSPVQVGDLIEVSIGYDTVATDRRPESNWGGYNPPGWVRVKVRDVVFERTNGLIVEVMDGANGDQHEFSVLSEGPTSAWPPVLSGPEFRDRRLQLYVWETEPPFDLLAGPELPTTLDVTRSDWAILDVGVSFENGLNAYSFQARLSQVPEPSSEVLILLGGVLGMAGLAGRLSTRSGA